MQHAPEAVVGSAPKQAKSSKDIPMPAKRLTFLDFARGLAAFAVILQHAAEKLWPDAWRWSHEYFNLGKFGVTLFFLTSGFVIPLTLERGNSVKSFWVKRFSRLYPLYWVSIAITLVLLAAGFHSITSRGFESSIAWNTLANLTMFQELMLVPHAIPLYYTLSLELAFYILFTLLFLGKVHQKTALHTILVLLFQSALSIAVPLIIQRRVPMAELFYWTSLFVGTSIYRYTCRKISKAYLAKVMTLLIVSTAYGIYLNYVKYKATNSNEQFSFIAVASPWCLAYACFFWSLSARNIKFAQPFTWLGKVSYSVYLLHPALLALAIGWHSPIFAFLFIVLGTLVLSHFTYSYIEKPCIDKGRLIAESIIIKPIAVAISKCEHERAKSFV